MSLSIMSYNVTRSIKGTQHNNVLHYAEYLFAECQILFGVMLCVVKLIAVMLNVVAPSSRGPSYV